MKEIAKRPRILFTTPLLCHPPIGGPFLRIENSIKALSQISELSLYCRTPVSGPEIAYYRRFCKNFYCDPSTQSPYRQITFVKKSLNICIKRFLNNDPFPENTDYSDLLRIADRIRPDIIWLGYGNISYPLLKYIKQNSRYKVVCDTDSVWSRFILRRLPLIHDQTEINDTLRKGRDKEEEERWGTLLADVTTAVSDIDADYYRKLSRNPEQVKVFSNVIDAKEYEHIPPKPKKFKKPCIYLAGSFGPKSPMDQAARWIIGEVLPLVKEEIPDIHFYIVGSGSDSTLRDVRNPSITITGRLPSVLPYLFHADVVVVPLKFESGTRFKILEAGACNVPVVSTTLGAEGLPVTHGENILIADTPQHFAREISSLISDHEFATRISGKLHELIKERYEIPALVHEGTAIINALTEV